MNPDVIVAVREERPLIHNLTNQVVAHFTANGLLAFGGLPVMAKAIEEVEDIVRQASSLLINMGTLTPVDLEAMMIAGKAANQSQIPVVLDPVGVAATSFRTNAVKQMLREVDVTVIKGNPGEMAHLVEIPWKTKGVDAIGSGDTVEIALKVAETYGTVAVVTGKIDIICVNGRIIKNESGHPWLEQITGAGCLLGSIVAACLTTHHAIEEQLTTAVHFYGLAAEYAASLSHVFGVGTFLPAFIDALSAAPETLKRRVR